MNLQTFFDNFELLAEAPNGVKKLRELILQLAVMGKLISQDPNDEPASILLEKITFERQKLIEKKKIRKSKSLPLITANEIFYQIPKTWKWIRLGEIGDWGAGATPDRKNTEYYGGSIKWFKSGELNDGYIKYSEEKITELALQKCSLRLNQPGDVLIAMYGATIGKVAILETEATTNQAVCACTCFNGFYNYYLFLLLKAYKNEFASQGAGGAQPNISREKIIHTIAPLPPLDEQHRIVAKVDQLLTLCDELEVQQQKKREARVRINNTAIAQLLTTCGEPEEFNKSWQRIYNNFDLLYSTPENISKLRSCILQLAVMGKLAPQDPRDEPACVLLEKIKAEKKRLLQEGKIKKLEDFAVITANEVYYKIPDNWSWVPLGELLIFGPKNGYSPKPVDYATKVKSITLSATTSGTFKSNYFKYIDEEIAIGSNLWLENNDLLIQRANTIQYVGVAAVYKGLSNEYIYPDLMMKLRFSTFIEVDFIHQAINSECSRNFLRAKASGTSSNMPKINQSTVNSLPIPLPPLAEQRRITAKVNQLMTLCDKLEAQLKQSVADSEKLMETAVRQLLDISTIAADNISAEATKLETKTVKQSSKKTQSSHGEAVQLNLPLF